MKNLITLLLISTFILSAKEYTISTTNGTEEIFFSLNDEEVSRNNITDWHLAFKTGGIAATIRIGRTVELYEAIQLDINNLGENIDLADLEDPEKFKQVYNEHTDWRLGAFNQGGSPEQDFNYGWGSYQQGVGVAGDKLYVIKYENEGADVYKQFAMFTMAQGAYNFDIADLDGSNLEQLSVNKADFDGKAFGYYNLNSKEVINAQPFQFAWDFVIKEYRAAIPAGPEVIYYPVVGFFQNTNLWVAQVENLSDEKPNVSAYDPTMNTIGYDWKSFVDGSYQYPERTYFLQRFNDNGAGPEPEGTVYRLRFISYEGGSQKTSTFELDNITLSYSEDKTLSFGVYPNIIENGSADLVYNLNGNSEIKVYDAAGNEVLSNNIIGNGKLNRIDLELNTLGSGRYFVKLVNGNQFTTSSFIIK